MSFANNGSYRIGPKIKEIQYDNSVFGLVTVRIAVCVNYH